MKVIKLIVCSVAISLGSLIVFATPLVANQDRCRGLPCSSPGEGSSECLMQGPCGVCAPDLTCRSTYAGP